MARVLLVSAGAPILTTANATHYYPVASANLDTGATTESIRQCLHRSAGKISNLYVRVTANSIVGTSTIIVRVNGVDTVLSVSIGSTLSGFFEDTTHNVSIATADLVSYKFVPGAATNTMTISILSVTFDAYVNTVTRLQAGNFVNYNLSSVSRYNHINGSLGAGTGNATESAHKTRIRKACTGKNLAVNVSANSRTADTTIRMRKNGANGAMSIPVAQTLTGWFEDTTNSDNLAVGDDYCNVVETPSGTESFTVRAICVDIETTNLEGILVTGTASNLSLAPGPSSTNYLPISGFLTANSTESDVKVKARDTFTFSELSILIFTNTITAASTLKLRKNGADTSMVVTIEASTIGLISDSTHTETVTSTDELSLLLTTGGTGTSLVAKAIMINSLGRETFLAKTMTEPNITISESRNRTKAVWRLQP